MIRRSTSGALLAAAALALSLTACSHPSSTGGSGGTSQLKWAIASAPRALDTYSDFSSNADVVDSLIYEGLVSLDNLKLKPGIASSWKATSPTTYVYELRKGVKFSDGNPVTPADVAYSLNRHVAKGSTSQAVSHLKTMKSAAVTGPHEVTVTLTQPDATWVYDPLFAPIVEKSVVTKAGDKYGAPGTKVVGTGPYKVTSFDASNGIVLERNSNYAGTAPKFTRVHFSYIADPSALSLALRSGEVDGSFGIALSQVSQFKKLGGVSLVRGQGLSTASLMFDMNTKPFDDVHVRRAIAYAWDAAKFTKDVLGGYAEPANAMVPPAFWTNLADAGKVKQIYAGLPAYHFDMAKARSEIARSSVPHGFSVSISYPDAHPELGQALQVLAQNLNTLGIKLKIGEIPYQQWVSLISAHKKLTIQIAQWNPDYPDPSDFILSQYASSHAVPDQYNLANYKNPTVDKLIDKELGTTDKAARIKDMTTILETVGRDVPNLNMYWPSTVMAIRSPMTYRNLDGLYYAETWVKNVSAG